MNYVDIFDIVVLSSLIGSFIVLFTLSIKLMFKNRLTSTFQYYIWMILIIKLIVPFGPHYSFNVSSIYAKFHTENVTNENTQKTLTKFLIQPQNTISNKLISTNTTRSLDKNITNNTSLKSKFNIKKALCFAWILGISILIAILAIGYKKLEIIIKLSSKDIIINCLITLLSIIYWFNPILLYGFHKMRQDC